jgi:hypothetical protein
MMVDYYVAKACQWDLAGGRNGNHSEKVEGLGKYQICPDREIGVEIFRYGT